MPEAHSREVRWLFMCITSIVLLLLFSLTSGLGTILQGSIRREVLLVSRGVALLLIVNIVVAAVLWIVRDAQRWRAR